ncbi:hypothetical protein FKM82_017868 [Ascaphus truei]
MLPNITDSNEGIVATRPRYTGTDLKECGIPEQLAVPAFQRTLVEPWKQRHKITHGNSVGDILLLVITEALKRYLENRGG